MLTRGRVAILMVLLLLVAAGWTAWQGLQAYRGFSQAERGVTALQRALQTGDEAAQASAIAEVQDGAARADNATSGVWWSALTYLPGVGDDFEGVQVIGSSLRLVAEDGLPPLAEVGNRVGRVTTGGRLDLDVVRSLARPMDQAATAFRQAADQTATIDSADLVDGLSTRFSSYDDEVGAAAGGLEAGRTAVDLVPGMAGGDGPRDYLLIFQNNAEVRATGGLPGSWARLHAEDGDLWLREQGSWPDFEVADDPVVELTAGEQTVFGESIATFFANPGYSRDFPRAARIWDAFWQRKYPQVALDGVLAIDPVALSYLVEGTGAVRVDDEVLTPDTLVQQVLNEPYLTLESQEVQDAFFQEIARTVFEAVTGDLRSPVTFVSALARAGQEGRFLVAPFDAEEAAALEGSRVEGSLEAPDPRTPRVDVGFNDATGSKMSYYLRWDGDVDAVDCVDGRQELAGRVNLRQNISPADAAELPVTVTGDGRYGTEPGSQLVNVQLYGPAGGSFGPVLLDGEQVEGLTVADVEGRPVAQLGILLDNRDDVSITWSMTSDEGQTGDPELQMTPGVLPGVDGGTSPSACWQRARVGHRLSPRRGPSRSTR